MCSPATLDAVLPAADRRPGAEAAAAPEAEAAVVQPELPPPEPPPPLPVSRLSYSGLEDYNRCGYRFYLERVLGMPRLEGQRVLSDELPGLLRGSIVHELLEGIDFDAPGDPSPTAIADMIAAHGAAVRESDVGDIARLARAFAGSELRERLAGAKQIRKELPFAFTLEVPGGRSVLVNGFMDVHALEEEAALVVDYKSDPLNGDDPVAVGEAKYATQRLVYALAALRGGAERVEVVHCFLERADEPVSAVFAADDAPRLEGELLALASGVIGGEFAPTAEPHRELCATCPGQPALCRWGPERTLSDPEPPVVSPS